ncbi:ecdysone oxidase-like [Anticarsia gemmatalis]|uniref:ecdysone oxidase-like n=1 Tax=Anticarsia gemmatalis TaxID=129554 RepID=UPI003F75E4E1
MDSATAVKSFRNVQNIFRMMSVLQLTAYWWPIPAVVPDGATYDYIIVGGGTAGCIIASRLVELKHAKVLLIEAGGNPPLESSYAGYFPYLKRSSVDWNMTSVPDETMRYHKGGVAEIVQGKMLGGSSGLTYLVYVRGNPVDYDSWATLTNDSSWSYNSILPLYNKIERVIDKKILRSSKDKALHGTKGKIKLRKFYYKPADTYLKAIEEMGRKVVVDVNTRNPLGFTNILYACGKKERQSTAYSYLRLVKKKPNLDVMTNSLVTKIIFDDTTAVGVLVKTKDNKIIKINAKKEVILTAGAFKTPQLLMLSGIGPKKHLDSKKIPVLADLPVGKNLQDHQLCLAVYKTGERKPPIGPPNPYTIGFTALDGLVALNKSENYPDYDLRAIVLDDPKIFLAFCAVAFSFNNDICDTLNKGADGRQIFASFIHLVKPKSRGEVLLKSTKIEDQPLINLNFNDNEEDVENQARYQMDFNKILNTPTFRNLSAEIIDPEIEKCGELQIDNFEYWKCFVRSMVTTLHYNVGTCAMGSVVDSKLFVKGVKNLRVADASIMPNIISSPTLSGVMVIAEKASKMIKKGFCSK